MARRIVRAVTRHLQKQKKGATEVAPHFTRIERTLELEADAQTDVARRLELRRRAAEVSC